MVPPLAVTVADPLFPPKQLILVPDKEAERGEGDVIVHDPALRALNSICHGNSVIAGINPEILRVVLPVLHA